MADIGRKALLGDSLVSTKFALGSILHINGVIRKCNTIAMLTFPEGINRLELIDALISYFSTFPVDMSASVDLQTCESHASWILLQKIHRANNVKVPIHHHHNPDSVVVHSVSNRSNPVEHFQVRVGTRTKPVRWVIPDTNPARCNRVGFTNSNRAFQPHNIAWNWVVEFWSYRDMIITEIVYL